MLHSSITTHFDFMYVFVISCGFIGRYIFKLIFEIADNLFVSNNYKALTYEWHTTSKKLCLLFVYKKKNMYRTNTRNCRRFKMITLRIRRLIIQSIRFLFGRRRKHFCGFPWKTRIQTVCAHFTLSACVCVREIAHDSLLSLRSW